MQSVRRHYNTKKDDGILFNNGLHGWHLSDEEYGKYYEQMLLFLQKSGAPIYIVLTTDDLTRPRRNAFVKTRNEVAKALAQKYHLPIIDLHTVATSNAECHVPDGVHFTAAGYELLAKCILETLPKNATLEMITSGFDLSLYTCTLGGASRVTVRCKAISGT